MQARADIKLELGTTLICLKTGEHYKIIKIYKDVNRRNTSGKTDKKYCTYVLNDARGLKYGRAYNKGDLLNNYRPLESETERILYGQKDST